jgi:hypothetical protein
MIRRLLNKFVRWTLSDNTRLNDVDSNELSYSTRPSVMRRGDSNGELRSNGMTFNLYAAEGGTVIETKFYDSKNDMNTHRLYIISDGEDFSNVLGQIVSMERMKTWH